MAVYEINEAQNNANKKLLNTLESHARIQEKINSATEDMIPIVEKVRDAFTSGAGFMLAAISAIETILLGGVSRAKEINQQLGVGVGSSAEIAARPVLNASDKAVAVPNNSSLDPPAYFPQNLFVLAFGS